MTNKIKSDMSVADLIEYLKGEDPEAPVFFACDYGDHCHTTQLLPANSIDTFPSSFVNTDSGYSDSGLSLNEDREGDDEVEEDEETEAYRNDKKEENFDIVVIRFR